jgi:hypothetical protein
MQDPVLLAMKALAAIAAVIFLVMLSHMIHREQAVASLHCPAPDHAIWAPSLNQAICGESAGFGFKAVKSK